MSKFRKKPNNFNSQDASPRTFTSIIVGSNTENSTLGPAFAKARMTKEQRAKRFQNPHSTRYDELRKNRESLKQKFIDEQLMPDPNKQYSLDEAITLKGLCEDYCPEFERYEREVQGEVDFFEKSPETGKAIHSRMVKKFQRAAAGLQNPMPCDVRSPPALERTLDHLVCEIIGKVDNFVDCHAFVRDRTRSIRKDFTFQHSRGQEAIRVHERVARFHIISLHELGEKHLDQVHEERRQLAYTLTSLFEFYIDARETEERLISEPEFRAYFIILNLFAKKNPNTPQFDFDTSSHYGKVVTFLSEFKQSFNLIWTNHPTFDELVKLATDFFKYVGQLKQGFLLGCLIELHFPRIRQVILQRMFAAAPASTSSFQLQYVMDIFAFDSVTATQEFCDALQLKTGIDKGLPVVYIVREEDGSPAFKASQNTSSLFPHKTKLVDGLKTSGSYVEVIYATPAASLPTPSPIKISFKRSNQTSTGDGSSIVSEPPTVFEPAKLSFKYPGLFKNSMASMPLIPESSKPKDILYRSCVSLPQDEASTDSLHASQTNLHDKSAGTSSILTFKTVANDKSNYLSSLSLAQKAPVLSTQTDNIDFDILNDSGISETFSAPLNVTQLVPASMSLKPIVIAEPVISIPTPIPSPVTIKPVSMLELYKTNPEDSSSLRKAIDKYNFDLKLKFFIRLRSKTLESRLSRKRLYNRALYLLNEPLQPNPIVTPSYYFSHSNPKNIISNDTQFEQLDLKIQSYKKSLNSPLDFQKIISQSLSKLSVPGIKFQNQKLKFQWFIPIWVENYNSPYSLYLRKKLGITSGSYQTKHPSVQKNCFIVDTSIHMFQFIESTVAKTPTNTTLWTPVFQIVSSDTNSKKFWESQRRQLHDVIQHCPQSNSSVIGIIYWPHSSQDNTDNKDIYSKLNLKSLEDQQLVARHHIVCMQPRDIELQISSLLDQMLIYSTSFSLDNLFSLETVVRDHHSEFVRLVTTLSMQSYLTNKDTFYFYIQLGLQCLEKSFELLNIDSPPKFIIPTLDAGLSNESYIIQLCQEISRTAGIDISFVSCDAPSDYFKRVLLSIAECSFNYLLTNFSQYTPFVNQVCPEYALTIDQAISHSQKIGNALQVKKRKATEEADSQTAIDIKKPCSSSDTISSFSAYAQDVKTWLASIT